MGRTPKNKSVESDALETGVSQQTTENPIPPENGCPLAFNSKGLRNGIIYPVDEIGYIDWVKLIDPKFIVPNKENFKKRGQPIPEDVSSLEDKDKLILLGGFKKLAQIRGYTGVKFIPVYSSDLVVRFRCEICWTANYETDFREICFEGTADATIDNTVGLGRLYLTAIAENRSFVRAVRNFLQIPILGQDEVGPDEDRTVKKTYINKNLIDDLDSNPTRPIAFLKKKLKEKGRNFEQLKERIVKDGRIDFSKINSEEDISDELAVKILGIYF